MSTEPKTHSWIWGMLWAVVVLLGVYVGGYFVLGEHRELWGRAMHVRQFPSLPVANAYYPLGLVECKVRDRTLVLTDPDGEGFTIAP